jgi:ATP-dependent DNA ligase
VLGAAGRGVGRTRIADRGFRASASCTHDPHTRVRDIPQPRSRGSVARYRAAMRLPFAPPIEPMLAKASDTLPGGDGWLYEPKWDGFRAIVFRDGDEIYTQSRDLKPLDRYFPELAAPFIAQLPDRCVLDGEVVIARDGTLDFEALLLRIHPAASRVAMLAAETPASFVAWDLLALGDHDLRAVPQGERRARLVEVLGGVTPPIHLTPATTDITLAADWFDRFEGAGLDGVVAKRLDGTYQPGKRAMLKIKHGRTADCVVAGFRWHKNGPGTHVGSLLLGLFDDEGKLHHVGITSSFTWDRRASLVGELATLREGALEGHPWGEWAEWATFGTDGSGQRLPGATSRWNRGKDLSWEPLRPERVVEVGYDHLQGDRFRHATTFKRWRPDKPPEACRYDQLEASVPYELARIFGAD